MPEGPFLDAGAMAAALPLERQVGQLLMVGFPGVEPPPSLLERIERGEVGGVILFSRNVKTPDQVRSLVRQLQDVSLHAGVPGGQAGIGLLIATDQEGGRVVRLKPPATWFPSAMALGATGDVELVEALALAMGRQLRAVGVNMDLAPVLDVNNNPANPVIGLRSYGEDPQLVARLGAAAVRGLQSAGVAATGKHFPGHGDTALDSHVDLPVVPHDRERLERVELVPFRAAIAGGISAIMTSHVVFPAIEPEPGRPATHSRAVLEGLLRGELGFGGLIVTDCLEMRAISDRFEPGEAAVRAFEAGADLILVSHTESRQREAYRALVDAARSGRISRQRLRESVERVLALKRRYGALGAGVDDLLPDVPLSDAADLQAAELLAIRASTHAVTAVESADLPLRSLVERIAQPETGVVVLELGEGIATMAEERHASPLRLAEALRHEMGQAATPVPVEEIRVASGTPPEQDEQALQHLRAAVLQRRRIPVVVTRTASRHPDQVAWARLAIELAPQASALVAMGTPYDLGALGRRPAWYLAAYGDQPPHVRAVAAVLAGKAQPSGRFPVTVA
ncbi:beta-N-acetylhexosaminidase [Carboxydochorda subterranea]|uniref:Beta-N-acetylhexosaminidase n=1 Tax=Carboxydichorda subterranea TaxID=3109565 RepID=A0ABZ1BYQ2_9FIRM|nr:beta-N-acetylhexosaminidase [Limnochorda sp. L945t]WRP17197.1 beta-N-acetylhexosaminidase [Limnochorda sp. L945t]